MKIPQNLSPVLESLEDRLVLSGLTDGMPVLKQLTFFDADGDKVTIKVTGQVAKGAGFQVSSAENGFDIDAINLVGLGSKNNLVINVAPVKLAVADRVTSNMIFTPGYTTIGSITAESGTDQLDRPVEGATALRHLKLNAAVVGSIELPEVDIFGALSLNTGRTAFVDRINTAAVQVPGQDISYNPSAGLIDLYDVTANSLGRILVNGVVAAAVNNPSGLPGDSPTNDLNGAITVFGNFGGITALRGALNGDVAVGGNLGMISVGQFNGTVNVAGDASVRLPAGFDGVLAAGGHLHLGWQPGAVGGLGVSNAQVFAGAGISGLGASLVDPVIVPGAYTGKLTNTSLSTDTGTAVADIRVAGGGADFHVVSSNSIASLRALSFGTGMQVAAGIGGIGSITSTAGGLAGTFTSAGNIGAISATGGAIDATFEATGNIGAVKVSTPDTDGLRGSLKSGGSIASIEVTVATLNGGTAINSNIDAGTTLGPVKVNSVAASSAAVLGSIRAADGITSIDISAATVSTALAATVNADSDSNGLGSLPLLTVTNTGRGGTAVSGANVSAASIGEITLAARDKASTAADHLATFTARNRIDSVFVSGNLGTASGATKFITTANSSSIGALEGTGTGDQRVQVSTGEFGTVGTLDFLDLTRTSNVDYLLGKDVLSAGAITVRGAFDGNFVLGRVPAEPGPLSVRTFSDIVVDGRANLSVLPSGVSAFGTLEAATLVLPSDLSNVTNLGSLNVGTVQTTAPVTLGSIFGSRSGPVVIGSSLTSGTSSPVTLAFSQFTTIPVISFTQLFSGQTIGSFTRP